jgi:gliding motility-associated lipoprotein GldH
LIRAACIGILFLLSLSACDRGVLIQEKWEWEDQQWITGDKKSMVMEAVDTSTIYQMDLLLNHEETYGYQNLYIKTTTTFPSGKEVVSVTSLELVDADGAWAGDMGENCCKTELPLQTRFTFPEVGKYTWTVEPWMRVDTIKGVNSLKVTCRKVKE